MSQTKSIYKPTNHVRIVTAASLFDGHDAAVNIMRRIMQQSGAEVIHLGHNRSARDIVECAIEEDAQGIAITSYQGGHVEFFSYVVEMLRERNAKTKVFGGGGGTILPDEIERLHKAGVTRLFSPDDGRDLGLQGMINIVIESCDFPMAEPPCDDLVGRVTSGDTQALARLITVAENFPEERKGILGTLGKNKVPVLGITGTGGAGKSSLVDELLRRFINQTDLRIAVLSIDPTRRRSGGALLGDRIRMNSAASDRVYMRSVATREAGASISDVVGAAVPICANSQFDLVIVETSGIGQSDSTITEVADVSLYVMTPEYGAATQLEKIDMIDFADFIAINKADKRGAQDALRDVRKQFKRNRQLFDAKDEELPIVTTVASQFGDGGTTKLAHDIFVKLKDFGLEGEFEIPAGDERARNIIVPPSRGRYLAEIAETSRKLDQEQQQEQEHASTAYRLAGAACVLADDDGELEPLAPLPAQAPDLIAGKYSEVLGKLSRESAQALRAWPELAKRYGQDEYSYTVRDKTIVQPLVSTSLSGSSIRRVSLPKYRDWGDILAWLQRENLPGFYPYTAGVFPLKRTGEDPARMFAGEGGPERTNKRFHYVSADQPARRLSTAFDSVTLYGENPDNRPDIYGKVGNSGVSVATVDDAKRLYSGFDLADPKTSVSMTINGPAPMILSFYLHAAIDQACEKYLREQGKADEVRKSIDQQYKDCDLPVPRYEGDLPRGNDGLGLLLLGASGSDFIDPEVYERLKADALSSVRGTVQADILKEDQAQNTCIFSTEFALRLMADVQEYFIEHKVRNFYSVSISGYHIAEAGANPITQLAFTLANGFTLVEYYLSRGMDIDQFAPNFSFFFSNGLDPEYSVIGRVARRIWARAIRGLYNGNGRSQKLKYHIQTSGRSLHAQEIAFNDIRTTLQALYAIYDNCNSLHTNAYDEAITTPTEESVRRALAIQLIINKELGLTKNENPLQGAFIIHELTDLVEEAVLSEFERISERGGVLGAMERMYQRTKIQEESLYYESRKHSGELPIVGVNTFLSDKGSPTIIPEEVIRSSEDEKQTAITRLGHFHTIHKSEAQDALSKLQKAALAGDNIFDSIMEAAPYCSLGQLSGALYGVGGQYRRNM